MRIKFIHNREVKNEAFICSAADLIQELRESKYNRVSLFNLQGKEVQLRRNRVDNKWSKVNNRKWNAPRGQN